MNKTLEAILNKYGAEVVIARIMEQLNILALSEDDEAKQEAVELLEGSGCDTEYTSRTISVMAQWSAGCYLYKCGQRAITIKWLYRILGTAK